jgi:7,8-dihydropterin-6-yl-methyl-4-(beta-D-ribofuranosyl)aminobenzene 5'-phosphate synthase
MVPPNPGGRLKAQDAITATVLFDNFWTDDRLKTGWGYALLLETPEHTVLFDTGENGEVLLENMRLLGKDPMAIEAVVISHAHGDHTGGLEALLNLGIEPRIYLLESFPEELTVGAMASQDVVFPMPGEEIVPGIRSTGQVGRTIPEQGLVLDTRDGPVLLTGCAHPGVVEMARRAADVTGAPVHAVLGGFHLNQAPGAELARVVDGFKEMGVVKAGPTHCSGLAAMNVFQTAYGENFQRMGVGRVLEFRE